ncbi:LytTR family transcriptional regulator DNA-binding domain-containing protein [Clostridium sp. D2Q-11]|uniref:LytTR family transcriptional regulator DNA-binding domain-containing protein n=1 Tax=Anaeromonas frigoriresistens TaxID=2683708 RepID=A0A942Z7V7_9FIRM|nr:LytTR family DNA-binding domain-containing protein [Anaeromonas frigoriresistens]MBS4539122.1 LytTR family transcriptional regulator DNA-binding domain-containing protein [Anaeromonas frigoriresistens]
MKRLAYRMKSGLNFIDFDKIIFIEKFNRKILIHTKDQKIETNGTLSSIYNKLDSEMFYRSHRSYIINVDYIKKISPWGEKSYRIIFDNTKEDALFSYDRYKEFKENYIGYG